MLNHLSERIRLPDRSVVWLGVHPDEGKLAQTEGTQHLVEFRLEAGLPVWRYQIGSITIEKRLLMVYGQNTVHIRYRDDRRRRARAARPASAAQLPIARRVRQPSAVGRLRGALAGRLHRSVESHGAAAAAADRARREQRLHRRQPRGRRHQLRLRGTARLRAQRADVEPRIFPGGSDARTARHAGRVGGTLERDQRARPGGSGGGGARAAHAPAVARASVGARRTGGGARAGGRSVHHHAGGTRGRCGAGAWRWATRCAR